MVRDSADNAIQLVEPARDQAATNAILVEMVRLLQAPIFVPARSDSPCLPAEPASLATECAEHVLEQAPPTTTVLIAQVPILGCLMTQSATAIMAITTTTLQVLQ